MRSAKRPGRVNLLHERSVAVIDASRIVLSGPVRMLGGDRVKRVLRVFDEDGVCFDLTIISRDGVLPLQVAEEKADGC